MLFNMLPNVYKETNKYPSNSKLVCYNLKEATCFGS